MQLTLVACKLTTMSIRNESELLDEALKILEERLPPGWSVEKTAGQGEGSGAGDALFLFNSRLGSSNGAAIVEAKRNFSPADVQKLLGGLTRRMRDAAGNRPILLVSEYLSPRTRDLLAAEDVSYLDLSGNLRLVMQMPPIFIETSGADRRPQQRQVKRTSGLSGAIAGQIVRFLAEVDPPYGVIDIEKATGISRGYVSRVLDRLADEALIQRAPRGPVERVDWPALLRRRGQSVDLFGPNASRSYIAPNGARAAFESIAKSGVADNFVVTGSFAAVRIAPIAAPALLVLYLIPNGMETTFDSVAQELRLLPAEESPDVILLRPANREPVANPRTDAGLKMVNLPQLVVDSLGGTGRMPSEGEAVLEWMLANEEIWRFGSLGEYLAARPRRS